MFITIIINNNKNNYYFLSGEARIRTHVVAKHRLFADQPKVLLGSKNRSMVKLLSINQRVFDTLKIASVDRRHFLKIFYDF